jgi:hypothetical protein
MLRAVVATILAAVLAGAAPPPPGAGDAAPHWRALTRLDVDAAHRLLLEDHPGAAPEAGDPAFRARLEAGYAAALRRAAAVRSPEGYVATMAAFATSMADKHIWSRPLVQTLDRAEWAGILIVRRGTKWVVGSDEEAADGPPLKGAVLLSCDGIPADRLAEERLGTYRAVWSVEAQRVQRAAWLLLDDGNPFLVRPKSCLFGQAGATRAVALRWRRPDSDLSPKMAALALRGAPGFGVRKSGEGWWIALQSFSEKALPVVEDVRAKAAELRAAPYVVLDLRGNGGGNSIYGRQIASALLGDAWVSARLRGESPTGCGGKVWRLSAHNLERLAYYRSTMGPRMGKEAAAQFTAEYEAAAAARARGAAFTGPARCAAAPAPAATPAAAPAQPDYRGRLFLLTDNSCFSSCLLVSDQFRRLGALHVGETTDANTHYMEVREDRLPSGLSMFSTLQAVDPSAPMQIGPFEPAIRFEGSIADTAAIERWIAGLAAAPAVH